MADENIFWLRKSDGTLQQMDQLWIREPLPNGHNQNRTEIDIVWMRDENGDFFQVYPTDPNPEATTQVLNNFWNWPAGSVCSSPNDSSYPPQFNSTQNELSIASIGKPIGKAVGVKNATTVSSEGLNNSIHYYNSFGQTDSNYSLMPWLSTANTFDPFQNSEWGHWGSITRRIPNINTTDSCPVMWQNYYFVRPYTRTTLGYGWGTGDDTVAWKKDRTDVDLSQGDWTVLPKVTNVPGLPGTLTYYEYLPDGLKGTDVDANYHTDSSITYPCNCTITTKLGAFDWNNSPQSTGNGMFAQLTKDTSSAEAFPVDDRNTTPHLNVDHATTPSAKSGKWVVIETATYNTGDPDLPCAGYDGGLGTPEDGQVCGQDSDTFKLEKEFIVAFVANYKSDGTSAYNFNYTSMMTGTNFWANTNGSTANDRWHTYDGDGYVFLFLRFVTSTLNPSFKSEYGEYQEPVLREFWIQPKAFQYVNKTGTSWSNKYMGIVLDSLPTNSLTQCYGDSDQIDDTIPFTYYYKNAVKTLPKYYFWNIPLPACPGVTLGSNKTAVDGSSNTYYWGTHPSYNNWSNTTGRVDLLGAGNDNTTGGSGFNAEPSTFTSSGGGLIPSYNLKLYEFNKKYSSIQGLPYGIGHGYGSASISPHPWCDCSTGASPNTQCPCPEYSTNDSSYNPWKQICSYAQAQPTGGYLLDESVSWYRTTFTSTTGDLATWGVTDWTTLGWKDLWCSDSDCGCSRTRISKCSSPTVADQMPGCNSPTCWDCIENAPDSDLEVQPYKHCLYEWWDDFCADAFKQGGAFRLPSASIIYNESKNTCSCPG